METYFSYGEKEIVYLKSKDKRFRSVIEQIGMVKRPVIPDLFAALVYTIIGQQISTKAHTTIWRKMQETLGDISPSKILSLDPDSLQSFGLTFRKVAYIRDAASKVYAGNFDIKSLYAMTDEEVCKRLSELKGIGVWSAEMLMLFSMQRPNILSYGDLAIQRGLRMIYHHREISREKFEMYRRRFSPYGSVASFYIWAVAGGAIEGMKDYAPKTKK